jgi:magnesium-transporting ATPase (P-type)
VIDSEDLARQLETLIHAEGDEKGYHGLTEHQASEFFKKYGPNALTEKKGLPWYLQFLLAMTGLFNYLLWAGAALCYISFGIQENKEDKSNLYLGIVLCLVVIVTAIFSYTQSSKSAALMA